MQTAKGASGTRWGSRGRAQHVGSSSEWPALVDSNILKRRPVRVPWSPTPWIRWMAVCVLSNAVKIHRTI